MATPPATTENWGTECYVLSVDQAGNPGYELELESQMVMGMARLKLFAASSSRQIMDHDVGGTAIDVL